ncbi:MAG: hypothetical protein HC814_07330 [Rhodobacteraceae bacterium]|nr:hypothetical protein [Paracoccaceae bacterium]
MADPFTRQVHLRAGGTARFYRIASDIPWSIRHIAVNNDTLVIQYADP